MPEKHTNPEQTPRPNGRKKLTPTDIILMLLGVLILFRTPWNNMNSFHYLLFFLYALCMLLRISNIRKERMHQMAVEARKAAAEAKALEHGNATENGGSPERDGNDDAPTPE